MARKLEDLRLRRTLADSVERVTVALGDENVPAASAVSILEHEMTKIQTATREPDTLRWGHQILPEVLKDAEERHQRYKETGEPVMGLPTGIRQLDKILNGLEEGVYFLAGPPGVGKTSFAFQVATSVSAKVPVLYVTFENSPANLILKAIAGIAGVSPIQVKRGLVDPEKLKEAAKRWVSRGGERVGLIAGSGQLTLAQLRNEAIRAMGLSRTKQCLVVVDYLQLWAKASAEFRGLSGTRERVDNLSAGLRELATRFGSPVLALSSQNREQGGYGGDKNSGQRIDSLKESGDLEYAADVVLFLYENKKAEPPPVPPARAVKLTVGKSKNSDLGHVSLVFRPDLGSFREASSSELEE